MTLTGYDLSKHNIDSNTDEKGLSGDFVILKASEGVSFKDSAHDGLASRARAAGIAVGHYHYCHPGHNSPETEADDFVAAANAKRGETMWLDFEPYKDRTNGELRGKNLPQWVLRFKARVEDQIDGPCGIYFNGDWGDTVMNAASSTEATEIRKMPLWKATQGASTPGRIWSWPSLTLWQWDASDGLDKDRFYGDLNTWKALAVGASITPKEWWEMAIPDADLNAIAARAALRVWQYKNATLTTRDAYSHLLSASANEIDTAGIAAAVAAALPPDAVVDQDDLEAALRKVLGSVDNVPPAP